MTATFRLDLSTARAEVPPSVRNARQSWIERPSALIALDDGAGHSGLGEVTPLDGYSPDKLEPALAALTALDFESLKSVLEKVEHPACVQHLEQAVGQHLPSAGFGLVSAALELRSLRLGQSLSTTLQALAAANQPAASAELAVAELLDLSGDWAAELSAARQRGTRHFKVKVGGSFDVELSTLKLLQARLLPAEHLRLDANRSLDEPLLERLAALKPEFVEEPLCELGSPRPLGVPLALDESLWLEPERARTWLESGLVRVVVLKPMALGLWQTLEWTRIARRVGADIVVSHAFDGAVAFAFYRTLARVIGTPERAMGLGSHPGLALWRDRVTESPA